MRTPKSEGENVTALIEIEGLTKRFGAFTAVDHQATLLSLDQRATQTYEAVGATVEQLAP